MIKSKCKIPLTRDEIIELDRAITKVFDLYQKLRADIPIASRINFPLLPSILSESIVIIAAPILFNLRPGWKAVFGGKAADILLKDDNGNEELVEVKSCGMRGTLELKSRDVLSDKLVWVNFGSRYHDGFGPITVYVLRNPSKYYDPASSSLRVVKLHEFLRKVESTEDLSVFEFADLTDIFVKGQETINCAELRA